MVGVPVAKVSRAAIPGESAGSRVRWWVNGITIATNAMITPQLTATVAVTRIRRSRRPRLRTRCGGLSGNASPSTRNAWNISSRSTGMGVSSGRVRGFGGAAEQGRQAGPAPGQPGLHGVGIGPHLGGDVGHRAVEQVVQDDGLAVGQRHVRSAATSSTVVSDGGRAGSGGRRAALTARCTRYRRQRSVANRVSTTRSQASGSAQSRTVGQCCQARAYASWVRSCASVVLPVRPYAYRASRCDVPR